MKVKLERPIYETKGEPLIETWSRWFSASTMSPRFLRGNYARVTAYGVAVRLPSGYVAVVRGPVI